MSSLLPCKVLPVVSVCRHGTSTRFPSYFVLSQPRTSPNWYERRGLELLFSRVARSQCGDSRHSSWNNELLVDFGEVLITRRREQDRSVSRFASKQRSTRSRSGRNGRRHQIETRARRLSSQTRFTIMLSTTPAALEPSHFKIPFIYASFGEDSRGV